MRPTSFVRALAVALVFLGYSLLAAQDDQKIASGPKKGEFVPAPFECYNMNGPAKGRLHCLVCKFALRPAVLIFAKEPAKGKGEALDDLLKQLDETAEEFQEREFSVGVVFLSPDARNSTNNADEEKAKEIIDETVKREALEARLKPRAEKLKHAIVAYYLADGPKGFNLNPKADVTILFYERLRIMENYAFGADALQDKDVKMIVKHVKDTLPLRKKKAAK